MWYAADAGGSQFSVPAALSGLMGLIAAAKVSRCCIVTHCNLLITYSMALLPATQGDSVVLRLIYGHSKTTYRTLQGSNSNYDVWACLLLSSLIPNLICLLSAIFACCQTSGKQQCAIFDLAYEK